MGITAGCSMKRRSFESGGARLILNLDQKEKKGRKKTTKSKNKKPKETNQPNRQFSKSVKGDGGVFTLILMLFFVFNLKLFYMLPKWWEELLQYLMFYM